MRQALVAVEARVVVVAVAVVALLETLHVRGNLIEDGVGEVGKLVEVEQRHVARWKVRKVEGDGDGQEDARRFVGSGERTLFGFLQGECRLGRDSMSATSQKLASSPASSSASRCGGVGFGGRCS